MGLISMRAALPPLLQASYSTITRKGPAFFRVERRGAMAAPNGSIWSEVSVVT
jgi:hypothetical protein